MRIRIVKEFKDDADADKAVQASSSSLTKLTPTIANSKDFARAVEALMKWIKDKKGAQLSSLEGNQNYKLVMNYLNKMQSDLDDKDKKQVVQKP